VDQARTGAINESRAQGVGRTYNTPSVPLRQLAPFSEIAPQPRITMRFPRGVQGALFSSAISLAGALHLHAQTIELTELIAIATDFATAPNGATLGMGGQIVFWTDSAVYVAGPRQPTIKPVYKASPESVLTAGFLAGSDTVVILESSGRVIKSFGGDFIIVNHYDISEDTEVSVRVDDGWLIIYTSGKHRLIVHLTDTDQPRLVAKIPTSADLLNNPFGHIAVKSRSAYLATTGKPLLLYHIDICDGTFRVVHRHHLDSLALSTTSEPTPPLWRSAGLTVIDGNIIHTLSDVRTDNRLFVHLNPNGDVLGSLAISSPMAIVAAIEQPSYVLAFRTIAMPEFVLYSWRRVPQSSH
jgi:hypothetical protein